MSIHARGDCHVQLRTPTANSRHSIIRSGNKLHGNACLYIWCILVLCIVVFVYMCVATCPNAKREPTLACERDALVCVCVCVCVCIFRDTRACKHVCADGTFKHGLSLKVYDSVSAFVSILVFLVVTLLKSLYAKR